MRFLRSTWQLQEITEDDGHVYGGLVADIGIKAFEYALKSYARDTTIEHGRQRCVIKPTVTRLYVHHQELKERENRQQNQQKSKQKAREWIGSAESPERSQVWMQRIRANTKNAHIVKDQIAKRFNLKKNDNRLHKLSNEVFRLGMKDVPSNSDGWHEINVDRYLDLADGLAPRFLGEQNGN
jgi:hypothetical protein